MAKQSPEIMEGDEESDVASFFMDICGLDYIDVLNGKCDLTREIWEKNLDKILNLVKERSASRVTYLIFGYFTLLTGANLPAHLRPAILDAADWKYEEGRWDDPDFILERKFYLEDFSQKIRDHKPGKITHLIELKNFEQDLKYGAIGLDQFWEFVFTKKIFSVKHINLDSCDLEEIPESIFVLINLKTLSLDYNQIKDIPAEIGNLVSLEELYLSDNEIIQIPETIGNLTSLKMLYLNNNKLVKIPEAIGNLLSIEKLYLNSNLIETLPKSILNLKLLKEVNLLDNKLKKIPPFLRKALFYIGIRYLNKIT